MLKWRNSRKKKVNTDGIWPINYVFFSFCFLIDGKVEFCLWHFNCIVLLWLVSLADLMQVWFSRLWWPYFICQLLENSIPGVGQLSSPFIPRDEGINMAIARVRLHVHRWLFLASSAQALTSRAPLIKHLLLLCYLKWIPAFLGKSVPLLYLLHISVFQETITQKTCRPCKRILSFHRQRQQTWKLPLKKDEGFWLVSGREVTLMSAAMLKKLRLKVF